MYNNASPWRLRTGLGNAIDLNAEKRTWPYMHVDLSIFHHGFALIYPGTQSSWWAISGEFWKGKGKWRNGLGTWWYMRWSIWVNDREEWRASHQVDAGETWKKISDQSLLWHADSYPWYELVEMKTNATIAHAVARSIWAESDDNQMFEGPRNELNLNLTCKRGTSYHLSPSSSQLWHWHERGICIWAKVILTVSTFVSGWVLWTMRMKDALQFIAFWTEKVLSRIAVIWVHFFMNDMNIWYFGSRSICVHLRAPGAFLLPIVFVLYENYIRRSVCPRKRRWKVDEDIPLFLAFTFSPSYPFRPLILIADS